VFTLERERFNYVSAGIATITSRELREPAVESVTRPEIRVKIKPCRREITSANKNGRKENAGGKIRVARCSTRRDARSNERYKRPVHRLAINRRVSFVYEVYRQTYRRKSAGKKLLRFVTRSLWLCEIQGLWIIIIIYRIRVRILFVLRDARDV